MQKDLFGNEVPDGIYGLQTVLIMLISAILAVTFVFYIKIVFGFV